MRRIVTAASLLVVAIAVNLPAVLAPGAGDGSDVAVAAAAPIPLVPVQDRPAAAVPGTADSPAGATSPLPIDSPTTRPTARPSQAAKGPATLVSRVDTTDPVVFLTLDDGLVTDPALERFLARRGIPVTTFLTTSTATPATQAFWTSMLDVGSVQNHTVVHPTLTALGTSGAASEICAANEDIVELTGTTPWMLRPPYGRQDASTLAAAGQCGLDYVVMWSVSLPAKFLRYQVGDSLRPGDIILSHYRTDLLPHLKRALREIEASGLRVARLEDYLRPRR